MPNWLVVVSWESKNDISEIFFSKFYPVSLPIWPHCFRFRTPGTFCYCVDGGKSVLAHLCLFLAVWCRTYQTTARQMYPFCIFASLIGGTGNAVAFDTTMNTVCILYCWFPLGSRDLCTCIFSTLCTVLLSKISSCWPWMTLTLILKINRTFVRHLSQYVYRFVGKRQRGGLSRTTAGSHRLIGNTDSTSVLPSVNIA